MTSAELPVFGMLKSFLASKAAEEAQKNLAGAVVKSAWSTSADGIKQSGFTERIQQMIFNASGEYISNYADRHGLLKVLGMMQPVWIEDIYTHVQFLDGDSVRQYSSLDNLEKAFRDSYKETKQRRFQPAKSKQQDGLEVANKCQYLMVLGQPGAGKSTFLRRIGLEALKRENSGYKHGCVPVFLELKRLNIEGIDIERAITREFATCGFPDPERSTKRLLEDGKLMVLLDGLDEVPNQQMDRVVTQIHDFCNLYKHNRFITSCRTAAYRSRFLQFTDVVMADFNDEQIKQFIANWFSSQNDKEVGTAQKCWDLLQHPEYTATRELAQTPLLLTFLCLVFDDSQTFPKQRAYLYKDALDVLLKKWAAEKRIQRDPIYQDLTLPLEEMLLSEIAYTEFLEDRLFFPKQEVVDKICAVLVGNLNAPKHLDGAAVLEAIQIQQGIFVERASNILSFSHLTLQEYLTAQYIVVDAKRITQLVTTHLVDQRYREVFLLVAGSMRGGADDLLLQMEAESQKYTRNSRLQDLLIWIDQAIVDLEGAFKPAAKRAIILFNKIDKPLTKASLLYPINRQLELNSMDGAYHLDQPLLDGLDDIEQQYPDVEELEHRYSSSLTSSYISNLADSVARILLRQSGYGFNVFPEFYKREPIYLACWSDLDWRILADYLYANELMMKCKESAVQVSPRVWQGIEERILTVAQL